MSSFPNFSNFADYIKTELDSRRGNTIKVSALNCWVRAISAVSGKSNAGMILYSNPDYSIFNGAADKHVATIYGDSSHSGAVGVSWDGTPIVAQSGVSGRPSPIITSFEVDEGSGNISRKANFTIRCFSVEQLEVISAYYLEPGFSVFLEWGWNIAKSLKGYNKNPNAQSIGQFQSFDVVNNRRSSSGGNSDVFLGFITGGSIGISDTYWDVQVKATGFTELPAYFMVADNAKTTESVLGIFEVSLDFGTMDIGFDTNLDTKRFKMAFNELPSNRKTQQVKDLISDSYVGKAVNFINFDAAVADKVNNTTKGGWFSDPKLEVKDSNGESKSIKVADGTKLIGPEKFIRFGALMKIMNTIAVEPYVVGDKTIKYSISTDTTVISAFQKVFSTDKSKLFIPNPNTPKASFSAIADGLHEQTQFNEIIDNSVVNGTDTVYFPENTAITNGTATKDGNSIKISYENSAANVNIEGLEKTAGQWGFLDNLYVNFDFAKGILETKNFVIKDALYQILNGISSAAGALWDFQIVELTAPADDNSGTKKGDTILQIVDMNLVSDKNSNDKIYKFDLQGANSIFIDAQFDMEIGGAIMNQVIGSRLGVSQQSSLQPYDGKLFSHGYIDLILKERTDKEKKAQAIKDAANPQPEDADAATKQQEKDLTVFLQKIALYPRVDKTDETAEFGEDPYLANYLAAYNDLQLFESFKLSNDASNKGKGVSILLPIKFNFTIHGIGGIKRGDKFQVRGLPKKYSEDGFFQVTAVKHTLDNMTWKTEIQGGFRQLR
jgi:hypothetical protein